MYKRLCVCIACERECHRQTSSSKTSRDLVRKPCHGTSWDRCRNPTVGQTATCFSLKEKIIRSPVFSCRSDGTGQEEWRRLLDTREPVSSLSHPREKSHTLNACDTETEPRRKLCSPGRPSGRYWTSCLAPSYADFHIFIFHTGLSLIIQEQVRVFPVKSDASL